MKHSKFDAALIINLANDFPKATELELVEMLRKEHGIETTEQYVAFVLYDFHQAMSDWIAQEDEGRDWEDCAEAY